MPDADRTLAPTRLTSSSDICIVSLGIIDMVRSVICGLLVVVAACVGEDEQYIERNQSAASTVDRANGPIVAPEPAEAVEKPLSSAPRPGSAMETVCDGDVCCPAGLTPITGTEQVEEWANSVADVCLLLGGGDDTLTLSGARSFALAGDGDDVINVDGSAFVAGGAGNDQILATGSGTEIDGGLGADLIYTGGGHHIITPGEGSDTVIGGIGDIVVQVLDTCELSEGESLVGGGSADLLLLPLPLAAAKALGVEIVGFERVLVTGATCRSSCALADCVPGVGV